MKMNKKHMIIGLSMLTAAGITAGGICIYKKMKHPKLDINSLSCFE